MFAIENGDLVRGWKPIDSMVDLSIVMLYIVYQRVNHVSKDQYAQSTYDLG